MTANQQSSAHPMVVSDETGSLQFRRNKGRPRTKKIQRKRKLRFRHIFFSFSILAGTFLAVQQICLFALTWDKMDIKDITIVCPNPEMREVIDEDLANAPLGNILLFDAHRLKEKVVSHSRVKSVHIRKVLPPSLIIEVEERQPFAVLKAEQLFLIDNEGVILFPLEKESTHWPQFVDSNNFEDNYSEKIEWARNCLESLPLEDRKTVGAIDVSEYLNIKIRLRNSKTWLFLGSDSFAEKLQRFQRSKIRLQKYGNLEYVDLRLDERFFLKTLDSHLGNSASRAEKEGD
jgi:cell division septal protein FtsQ